MRRIVLTGASGGIGSALAARLAGPGVSMLLIARDPTRLAETAAAVERRGGAAELACLDVTDAAAMAAKLARFDTAAPVDVVLANAGISSGTLPGGDPETAEAARRTVETNLIGAINTVAPLLAPFRARKAGRIALISSMAALRPLPAMPAYGASKAGLRAYGIALRGALRGTGVSVSVVCPGFVTSPMSARHRGARPFELPPDRAAERIVRGLERRQAFVTFPWQLAVLSWLDSRLPPALSDRLVAGFAAEIEPDGG